MATMAISENTMLTFERSEKRINRPHFRIIWHSVEKCLDIDQVLTCNSLGGQIHPIQLSKEVIARGRAERLWSGYEMVDISTNVCRYCNMMYTISCFVQNKEGRFSRSGPPG